jgi:hypothetical protein
MVNPSTVPMLTDDELMQLMPPGGVGGPDIFALDKERWLTYRAVVELTAARGRLELAKRLLQEARAALHESSEVTRLAAAQRISEGLSHL